MLTNELVGKMVGVAINAPSGHNCQPWKFVAKKDALFLYNDPSKDMTLFNYKQKGSYISHGAVIENLAVTASHFELEAKVDLFPEGQNSDLVAKIRFSSANDRYTYGYLFPQIMKRSTNRKPYGTGALKPEHMTSLSSFMIGGDSSPRIVLAEGADSIARAAELFSVGDRVLFDNHYLHRSLFSIVNWTIEEELQKKTGLFLGTKELTKPAQFIFKHLIRHWFLMKFFSFLRFPKKMAEKRRALYSHSSAIGVVMARDDSPAAFVEAGRLLQRFWLKTSQLGISFQPISVGLIYLGQRTMAGDPKELGRDQSRYVKEAYRGVLGAFRPGSSSPAFSFRIGYSDPPSARSAKRPPDLTFM